MKAFLKYLVALALGLAAGNLLRQADPGRALRLHDLISLNWRGQVVGAADVPAPPQESRTAPLPLTGEDKASVDEELDYMFAQRLGSLKGWRAFLDAHGGGVHAPLARAEVERLRSAQKALASGEGEASNGPPSSPDATVAAPPSAATGAAPLDAACERDAARLGRLRANPSVAEAVRLSNELRCETLRPRLLAVLEDLSSALAPAPARSPRSADAPTNATPADVCASERAALDQLRRRPSAEGARLLWGGLRCQSLRPQIRPLVEALGVAADSSGSGAAAGGLDGSGRAPDMVRSAVQSPARPAAK